MLHSFIALNACESGTEHTMLCPSCGGELSPVGETPSPEMVAASGSTGGLKRWVAWTCLACILVCMGTALVLSRHDNLLGRVPMEQPPEVLTKTAHDVLRKSGYTDLPADSVRLVFGNRVNRTCSVARLCAVRFPYFSRRPATLWPCLTGRLIESKTQPRQGQAMGATPPAFRETELIRRFALY